VKALQVVKKYMDIFGRFWAFLMLAIVLFPTLEAIVFRTILNKPTIWTAELTTMIFGIFFFIGAAYCEAEKGHVVMDLFSSHYTGYGKIISETVNLFACMIYCSLFIYFGGRLALEVILSGEKSESIWGPYLWPSRIAIPAGALMLLFRTIISYIEKMQLIIQELKERKK
jgi:TRAP-type mannitol/chloroaromatic compound transport system permease small subunit